MNNGISISPEVIIFIISANGVFLSFCVHLLITINGSINKVIASQGVSEAGTKFRLEALERSQQSTQQDGLRGFRTPQQQAQN